MRSEWKVMHWRSGSRPWTCVHAHGPDVELIMEASCKIFNHLGNSFGVIKLDPHQLWFRPYCSSLIPFLRQVEVFVFRRTIHLSNLYSALPSSIPSGISRISRLLMSSSSTIILADSSAPGLWVNSNLRRPINESIQHANSITLFVAYEFNNPSSHS